MLASRSIPVTAKGAWALLTVFGAVACGDSSSTEPPWATPTVARIEAVSATTLTGTVGADVTPLPTVRTTDEHGGPVKDVPVVFSVASGDGVLTRIRVETNDEGLATVGGWRLGPAVGNQRVVARVVEVGEVVFTAVATAGPVARIVPISGHQQMAATGTPLAEPLVVKVADGFDNSVAGAEVTFAVIAGDGHIEGATAITNAEGIASSGPWTLGAGTGWHQVRALSGPAQTEFLAWAQAPLVELTGLTGQLAFASGSGDDSRIYLASTDGSGLTRLTDHSAREEGPRWSPDGSRIAFLSHRAGGSSIHVMAVDGGPVTQLTEGPHDGPLTWSPDGLTIAYSTIRDGSSEIVTVDLATGTVGILYGSPGYEAQPSWSPDGQFLAFVSDRDMYDFVFNLYVMNADGTAQTRRTAGGGVWPDLPFYFHPTWSPDGSQIAFVRGIIVNTDDIRFTVAVMSADGAVVKELAWAGDLAWRRDLHDPGPLTWSPDGSGIAYSFVDCDLVTAGGCSGMRSVHYVSLDGTQQGLLIANAHSPSWRP